MRLPVTSARYSAGLAVRSLATRLKATASADDCRYQECFRAVLPLRDRFFFCRKNRAVQSEKIQGKITRWNLKAVSSRFHLVIFPCIFSDCIAPVLSCYSFNTSMLECIDETGENRKYSHFSRRRYKACARGAPDGDRRREKQKSELHGYGF